MLKRPQVMLDTTIDFVFFYLLCSHSKKQTMTDNLRGSLKQYLLLKILSEDAKASVHSRLFRSAGQREKVACSAGISNAMFYICTLLLRYYYCLSINSVSCKSHTSFGGKLKEISPLSPPECLFKEWDGIPHLLKIKISQHLFFIFSCIKNFTVNFLYLFLTERPAEYLKVPCSTHF